MEDVKIPMQTCLKMLKSPRATIIKLLIENITETMGIKDESESEDESIISEGHLDPPEA